MPSTRPARAESAPPPEAAAASAPLWVVLACEDHPKLCTGRRLLRLGMARPWGSARPSSGAIVLDPHAATPITRQDAARAQQRGIVAVDCSWNKLGDRGGFPPAVAPKLRGLVRRRLPMLLAANPQHYGRWAQLNTAEALGAALRLTAGEGPARAFFDRLAGERGFLELNRGPLQEYEAADGPEAIPALEALFL